MLRIGVTGLIASGKSVVSKLLSEYTKFPIINADSLAREATAKGSEAVAEIALEFGNEYIKDGEIDRSLLAKKVFSDEEAKKRLNAIVHYRVGARYQELLERYENIGVEGIILIVRYWWRQGLRIWQILWCWFTAATKVKWTG